MSFVRVLLVSTEAQLRELREALSFVDLIMLDVLRRRAFIVKEILRLKQQAGIPVRVAEQEQVVIRRVLSASDGGYPPDVVEAIYRAMFDSVDRLAE